MEELVNKLLWFFIIFSGLIVLIKNFLIFLSYCYTKKCLFAGDCAIVNLDSNKLPPVSIVIPIYNEERVLNNLFSALSNLKYPKSLLELIFVDDNSSDSTLKLIKEFETENDSYNIKSISAPVKEDRQGGKSPLLNFSLSVVSNEILVFYDADTFVAPNSLKNLVCNLVQDCTTDLAMGVCIPLNKDENLLTNMSYFEALYHNWIYLPAYCLLFSTIFPSGRNYATRKSCILNAGGWDENSVSEDYGLGLRLLKNNKFRPKIILNAKAYEITPHRLKDWFIQRIRWNRANLDTITTFFFNLKYFLKDNRWFKALPNLSNYLCDSFFILFFYGILLLLLLSNTNFIFLNILFSVLLIYLLMYNIGYWIALKRENCLCLSNFLKIFVMWPIYQHMILFSVGQALYLKITKGIMKKRITTEKSILKAKV